LDTVAYFESLALSLLLWRFALPSDRIEWLEADIMLLGTLTFLIVFQIEVIGEYLEELFGLSLLVQSHMHIQVLVHFLLHFCVFACLQAFS
jgi:hypothetical protein